ncbi:MAG: radical SAM protein, partial [Candidatus Cloacimonadia bacterium]
MRKYKLSRYNILFGYKNKYYIYNSMSNALANIEKELYVSLQKENLKDIDKYYKNLQRGNFIIPTDLNELEKINFLYEKWKHKNLLALTLVPTLMCNLHCKYCYQKRRNEKMNEEIYKAILNYTIKNFLKKNIKSVSLTWYGGEPLLLKQDIIKFHKDLSNFVEKKSIETNIVTNGILLNRDFINTLKKLTKIHQIQVTFDGSKEIHDRKRYLKNGKGTYDIILNNVLSIIDLVPISIRVNIDKTSIKSIDTLLEHFVSLNLNKHKNFILYFGHLRKYSEGGEDNTTS